MNDLRLFPGRLVRLSMVPAFSSGKLLYDSLSAGIERWEG